MKAILIDPKNCTVTEVEHDGSLGSIYALTRTDIVETARHPFGSHTLYVDEEGLLKTGIFSFEFNGYPYLYGGCGLLVGPPDYRGDDSAVTMTADDIRTLIRFPKRLSLVR